MRATRCRTGPCGTFILWPLLFLWAVSTPCANGQALSAEKTLEVCAEVMPKDPRQSVQPLAPGFTWTYRLRVSGEPKTLRWFTEDFVSGSGFSIQGLHAPMDDIRIGDYTVRYTTMSERKAFRGTKGQGCFLRMRVDDLRTTKELTGDERLYWGRWRYGTISDVAICELRTVGSVSKAFLEVPGVFPQGVSQNRRHVRYLSNEILYDWPRPGVATIGSLNLALQGVWNVQSDGKVRELKIAGRPLQAILTRFTYEFGGYATRKITEDLHYVPGVGLTKWVQSEEGQETWSMELVSSVLGK